MTFSFIQFTSNSGNKRISFSIPFYINEKLEFEGEYSHHKKWNGKGYDENGNVIYELINGNGKVKEYYYNCRLRFEGEYLNGKRNGKGKEYDEKGELRFDGYYLYYYKIRGKEYFDDILIFEGEYLNGKGKVYNDGELIFEGEYLNGKRNGKGKEYDYYNGRLIFEGEYLNGKRNGKGKEYYDNDEIYDKLIESADSDSEYVSD